MKDENEMGMSQWGAKELAVADYDYEKILRYYYAIEPPYIRSIEVWCNDTQSDYKYHPRNFSEYVKSYYSQHRVYAVEWSDEYSSTDPNKRISRTKTIIKNGKLYGRTKLLVFGSESIDVRKNLDIKIGNKPILGYWKKSYYLQDNPPKKRALPDPNISRTWYPIWEGHLDTKEFKDGEYGIKIEGKGLRLSKLDSDKPYGSGYDLDSNPGTVADYELDDEHKKINIVGYEKGSDENWKVMIDNNAPYLAEVEMEQSVFGDNTLYRSFWEYDKTSKEMRFGILGRGGHTLPGSGVLFDIDKVNKEDKNKYITFRLTYSEPMDKTKIPEITVKNGSKRLTVKVVSGSRYWANDKEYIVKYANFFAENAIDASKPIIISFINQRDLAGNWLDGDPRSIAKRINSTGNRASDFVNYETSLRIAI